MDLTGFLKDILVVIVVYKKDVTTVLTTVTPQLNQNPEIYIYDNSPESQPSPAHIHYQHDPGNGGVSKAYNEALKKAQLLKKKWMFLLDQDTIADSNIFHEFDRALKTFPHHVVFAPVMKDTNGIASPYKFFFGKGIRQRKFSPGIYKFSHFQIINSGMFIRVDAFRHAGGYDERFPMDFSDVVFLDRVSSRYPEFVLINWQCTHRLSSSDSTVSSQDALKRFEIFSKAIRLYKKNGEKFIMPILSLLPLGLRLLFRYHNPEFLRLAIKC
jgi:hypothetical protein